MRTHEAEMLGRAIVNVRGAVLEARVEEINVPKKVEDERRRRIVVHVVGGADLFDAALIHHGDAIGDFQRFLLIVRDVDRGGPEPLMQRLDLKRGQQLHVTELAGGGFQALPYDPDFEKTMDIAEEIMDEYRDTLAALAK